MDHKVLDGFSFTPDIRNAKDAHFRTVVAAGMGGSGLPVRVARDISEDTEFILYQMYGLPRIVRDDRLYVAISYSGNTAETLSFAEEARKRNLPLAVITSGGKLLEFAVENSLPYVTVPSGMQPRYALGYLLSSLLSLGGETEVLERFKKGTVSLEDARTAGESLSNYLRDVLPLFYSSVEFSSLSYIYKILFNETGKRLAFSNVVPELNHNELESLSGAASALCQVFVRTGYEEKEVGKRMKIMEAMFPNNYSMQGVGDTVEERMIYLYLCGICAAEHTAQVSGKDPSKVETIEDFKRKL